MPTQAAPQPERLKMLIFRASRRGFLEADLILGPFATRHVAELSGDQLDEFEHLLDQPDQDLYGWIVGLKPTPAAFDTPLMARIRDFRLVTHAARLQTEAVEVPARSA